MIRIKKFKEKWIAGLKYKTDYSPAQYYEIFKNPTTKELKEVEGHSIRGIVLKNGEFYIVVPCSDLVHSDLIRILNKIGIIKDERIRPSWWKDPKSLNKFVCITQIENSFTFEFAESYVVGGIINMDLDILNQYKINFEKENPNYTLEVEYLQ